MPHAEDLAQVARLLDRASGAVSRAARSARESLSVPTAAAVMRWLAWLDIQKGLGELSVYRYARTVISFLADVEAAGKSLEQVDGRDFERFMFDRAMLRGVTANSQATYIAALRSFFGWHSINTFTPNPTASLPSPRRRQRIPRRFSHSDIRRLLATCDRTTALGARDYCIILFALVTGARRAELAAVDLEDVELSNRLGRVLFHGKGGKERIVPFADRGALEALREWLTRRDAVPGADRSALFVSLNNTRTGRRLGIDGFDDVIRRAIRRAGLRLPPGLALHGLRATFASELYDAGVGLEHIRFLLGHADLNTTRRYIALSRRQQQARLPAEFTDKILGRNVVDLPMWVRHKRDKQGRDSS